MKATSSTVSQKGTTHSVTLIAGLLVGHWLTHSSRPADLKAPALPPAVAAASVAHKDSVTLMSVGQLKSASGALIALPEGAGRRERATQIFDRWSRLDANGALAEATRIMRLRDDLSPILAVLKVTAEADPMAAMSTACGISVNAERATAVRAVLETWAAHAPADAWAYVLKHDSLPGYWSAPQTVLQQIAATDPARALTLGLALPSSTQRENAINANLSAWVRKDVQAALAWAKSQPDPEVHRQALQYGYQAWAKTSPSLAVDAAAALPDAVDRAAALQGALEHWLGRDINAALAKAAALGDRIPPGLLASRMAFVAGNLTDAELLTAGRQLPAPTFQDFLSSTVRNRTMHGQYQSSVALLNEMPDGEPRLQVLRDLAQNWSRSGTDGFRDWIEKFPRSDERDQAIMAVSQQYTGGENVLDWKLAMAGTISNTTVRETALTQVLSTWAMQDQPAAFAWIQRAVSLTPAQKEKIQEAIRQSPALRFKFGC